MPSIFLLDYDGTLARTDEAIARCMFDTLAEVSSTPPDPAAVEDVVAQGLLIGRAFATLLGQPEGELSEDLARRYLSRYAAYDRQYARAFPEARPTLEALKARGARLLVVTNKMTENAELSLGHVGLADLVEAVIGAGPGLPPKPDPRVFTERVAPLFPGVAPERFMMVGDTEADLGFARAAGLRAAWASYGFGRREACMALNPDYRLAGIADLLTLPD